MNNNSDNDVIKMLKDLCQLDIDAAYAYEQALKQIDDQKIHQEIESFRQDHLRHIDDLNDLLKKLGQEPLEISKDFKGFLIEGFTAIRSMTGIEGALSAMEGNEKTTNKHYSEALKDHPNLDLEVKTLLENNYGDEKTHLNYIQNTLKQLKEKN